MTKVEKAADLHETTVQNVEAIVRSKRKPRAQGKAVHATTRVKVNPLIWDYVMKVVEVEVTRIWVMDPGTVVIYNSPKLARKARLRAR